MKLLLIIFLSLVLLNSVVLDKALAIIAPKELKRRARGQSDHKAASIYKMAAYDQTLHIFLWIKGALAAAVLVIILANKSWVLALAFIVITAWAVRVWRPPSSTNGWVWGYAAKVAPLISTVISYMQPILKRLIPLASSMPLHHRALYEKEDLIDLINAQSLQPENRIPEEDLKILVNTLNFGNKDVGNVMTPLRTVRLVKENEQVGPLLMDELHSSGFSRFPVIKSNSDKSAPSVVGTLYIKDLVDHTAKGSVQEVMDKKVFYVNETSRLRDALDAFLKTHHHLFIVVNNFEEIVGVLSIEDILEQILGQPIIDEFDRYDDLRAVASKEAKKDHTAHQASHPDPPENTEPVEE